MLSFLTKAALCHALALTGRPVKARSIKLKRRMPRPFIGWVCGLALFYNFIARDLMLGFGFDLRRRRLCNVLTTILYALLGLGGMRTFEKLQGRAK